MSADEANGVPLQALERAVARGAAYLLAAQDAEGWWRDYDGIGIGGSDGWVTAAVGGALALLPDAASHAEAGRNAARRAAAWLVERRPYAPGFGYNPVSGPDADTTAHALLLLRALGLPADPADEAWLADRFLSNGGCATYPRRDCWGIAHIDVTPPAWLALPPPLQGRLRRGVTDFVRICRQPDGTWPAYWWASHHYSTHWNLRLLAALGRRVQPPPVADPETLNAFELAHALGAAALSGGATARLAQALLATQSPDGSWPGSANLRVTDPSCPRPWETPRGRLHIDHRHLITTASAVDVLARLLQEDEDA